jgi:retron-type reverse transcriptase
MTSIPDALTQWRMTWQPDEIAWRTGWIAARDDRRQERLRRKEARRRRDRTTFGVEMWGTPKPKREARTNANKLRAAGLPVLNSETELADWLGIALPRLRWYTHDKVVDTVWHYVRYERAKKSGGTRVILAPKRDLKALQRKIYTELLIKRPTHPAAHGFAPEHSIVTNAAPHVGRAFILNMDLKDFFPTIAYRRVRALFLAFGYSYAVGSALALLCTERDRRPVARGGKTVYAAVTGRTLIQGAPTSPALANLAARRLDTRLAGLAAKHGVTYTRYADDLTFSGDDRAALGRIEAAAARIIAAEGFIVHPDKTRLYRRSTRQMVTGIVVNDHMGTPRDLRRRVRAILHAAQTTGLEAQNREGRAHFRAYLRGLIAYIGQANPAHARALLAALDAVGD